MCIWSGQNTVYRSVYIRNIRKIVLVIWYTLKIIHNMEIFCTVSCPQKEVQVVYSRSKSAHSKEVGCSVEEA